MTGMDDWHGWLAWMTGNWHGWLPWMTGMDDWHGWADISYFYILTTDRQTDWRTDLHWYLLSRYRDWKLEQLLLAKELILCISKHYCNWGLFGHSLWLQWNHFCRCCSHFSRCNVLCIITYYIIKRIKILAKFVLCISYQLILFDANKRSMKEITVQWSTAVS